MKKSGPLVLRFATPIISDEDRAKMTSIELANLEHGYRYHAQYNGEFVRPSFTSKPCTPDIQKAKVFSTLQSAKTSSYWSVCEPVFVNIVPVS